MDESRNSTPPAREQPSLDAMGGESGCGLDVSIVIPEYNEEESIPELVSWIGRVVRQNGWRAEIIFVDDGSTDGSWQLIAGLEEPGVAIHGIRFQRNYGKAAALHVAFQASRGRVVFTMDSDLQDSPDELPGLLQTLQEGDYDLVSGWKRVRHDPKLTKNLPSKLFNATARWITGIKLHDFNCGLKVYRSEVVKSIELYGDMHRYVPAIAKAAGFTRIGEKEVRHYPRKYGKSKFGLSRFVNGYLDLITVSFVGRFGKRPMHFFGLLGSVMFLLGGVTAVWLIVEKIVQIAEGVRYRNVTDQPLFFLALTLVILGVQCFLAGFLGEMVGRNSPIRNRYNIRDRR